MKRAADIPAPGFIATAALCAVVLILTPGCDDTTIDPFSNDGRIFTVYGYLDQYSVQHAVRVIPITRTPARIESHTDRQAEIDARVYSTNLETEQRIEWNHELARLSDGRFGHVFRSSFSVAPATTYRLEIVRSDGSVATAETTLPYLADVSLLELDALMINFDSTDVSQRVTIPGINNFRDIQAVYLFDSGDDKVRLPVGYGRSGGRTTDGDWAVTFNYAADMAVVRDSLAELIQRGLLPDVPFGITMVGVRVTVLDDAWALPTEEIDVDLLAQPGTLSNVENGYGFWGSVTRFQHDWDVTTEFSQLLGNPF